MSLGVCGEVSGECGGCGRGVEECVGSSHRFLRNKDGMESLRITGALRILIFNKFLFLGTLSGSTEQAFTGLPAIVLPKIVLTPELQAVFVRY